MYTNGTLAKQYSMPISFQFSVSRDYRTMSNRDRHILILGSFPAQTGKAVTKICDLRKFLECIQTAHWQNTTICLYFSNVLRQEITGACQTDIGTY